jgi:hypothetical protein
LKCEKYIGFKAEMEKNRPIRDQFPNKNRVPIVKDPHFSWLYGLPNGSLSPPKMLGTPKINSRKKFNKK